MANLALGYKTPMIQYKSYSLVQNRLASQLIYISVLIFKKLIIIYHKSTCKNSA